MGINRRSFFLGSAGLVASIAASRYAAWAEPLLSQRTVLQASTTFYCNSQTGNLANDGLTPQTALAR